MAEHKIKITTNKMRVISFEDKNVIQKITKDEATNIIETYKPIGKFYLVDGQAGGKRRTAGDHRSRSFRGDRALARGIRQYR